MTMTMQVKTPTTVAPTLSIVSAPGIRPTRMEMRKHALNMLPEFLICPFHGDEALEAEWRKGTESIPKRSGKNVEDGGYDAFVAGRELGLMGIPSEKPDEDARAALWLEGRQEGAAKAAKSDQSELSFARGFRAGTEDIQTKRGPYPEEWNRGFRVGSGLRDVLVSEEDCQKEGHEDHVRKAAYDRGWKMALSIPESSLECPYPSQGNLEEQWFLGVEECLAKQHRDAAKERRVNEELVSKCPFREGTASRKIFLVLAEGLPAGEDEIAKATKVPKDRIRRLLEMYSGNIHSCSLQRAGLSVCHDEKGWSLREIEAKPNAKRKR